MYKFQTSTNAIKVGNIAEYFANKREREKAIFSFRPTGPVYIYEGVEYSPAEMETLLPLALRPVNCKGINPDIGKAWLQDNRSY